MSSSGFDVLVLTVRHSPDGAALTLARLFGLTAQDAERLCAAFPCTPVRDVPYHHAERLAAQARSAGLEVQVVAHALDLGRATLPEISTRLTLPELGKAESGAHAARSQASPAPVTLRPCADAGPALQPTVLDAPALAAAQALAAQVHQHAPAPLAAAEPSPHVPTAVQAANALELSPGSARCEPWFEDARSRPSARVPARSQASGFAATFGSDTDFERALPPRTAANLTLLPSVDLMRDSSLPFADPDASAGDDAVERKSLGFLLSFPAAPRSAEAAPKVTSLPRDERAMPAWPRVDTASRAALEAAASERAARAHSVRPRTPQRLASAPSSARTRLGSTPPSKRTLRPANLSFGANDGGGTGLPRRTVWLLGVLWLSVALLLWSRGLLF